MPLGSVWDTWSCSHAPLSSSPGDEGRLLASAVLTQPAAKWHPTDVDAPEVTDMVDGSNFTSSGEAMGQGVPAGGQILKLPPRQREVLSVIANGIVRNRPPTNSELRTRLGVTSSGSIDQHLRALERKGIIQRDKGKWRGIRLTEDWPIDRLAMLGVTIDMPSARASPPEQLAIPTVRPERSETAAAFREQSPITVLSAEPSGASLPNTVYIPIVGRVSAGQPILAHENIEGWFPLLGEDIGDGEFFMLRVQGSSMYEAGIFPNDLVIVRQQIAADNGDIVVAELESEGLEGGATVKYLSEEAGQRWLVPANPNEPRIDGTHAQIAGKVIGVLRWIKRAEAPFTPVGRHVAAVPSNSRPSPHG